MPPTLKKRLDSLGNSFIISLALALNPANGFVPELIIFFPKLPARPVYYANE
jgi:hypothetical protein